jgi:hypothetical protein
MPTGIMPILMSGWRERDHQGRSRRRAALEPPDIPHSPNPLQIELRVSSTGNAEFFNGIRQERTVSDTSNIEAEEKGKPDIVH